MYTLTTKALCRGGYSRTNASLRFGYMNNSYLFSSLTTEEVTDLHGRLIRLGKSIIKLSDPMRGKPCRSGQGQERGQRLLACGEDGSGRGRKTRAKPASVKQEVEV